MGGGGGDFDIKVTGMLVVSLRVVIADFSLTYGVWDEKSLYLPIQTSLRAVHKEMYKNCRDTDFTEISFLKKNTTSPFLFFFRSLTLIKMSVLGVSLSLSRTHIGLP